MNFKWKIAPAAIADMRAELAEHLSESIREDESASERVAETGLYLESLTKLRDAGELVEVDPRISKQICMESLKALDGERLREDAEYILVLLQEALDTLPDRDQLDALTSELSSRLSSRQRFYRRLMGARIIDNSLDFSEENKSAVEYFDHAVRPFVWALSFSNAERDGHARLIKPEERMACWWWTEALTVSWDTVSSAEEVAETLEQWPTFAVHFERCRKAARIAQIGQQEESDPINRKDGRVKAGVTNLVTLNRAGISTSRSEPLSLAAESIPPKIVAKVGKESHLVLSTSEQGFHLWILVGNSDQIEGIPCLTSTAGKSINAELRPGNNWLFSFQQPPQTGWKITFIVNGEQFVKEF